MRRTMITLLTLLSLSVLAQPISTVIKTQAIDMGRALLNHDQASFVKFLNPEMRKIAGSSDLIRQGMDSAFVLFEAMGGKVNRINYGDPSEIIPFHGQLQTTLTQSIFLSTSFAEVEVTSILLAVSLDGGKQWYFTEPNAYKAASKKFNLKPLSPKLIIPTIQQPRITPKNQ